MEFGFECAVGGRFNLDDEGTLLSRDCGLRIVKSAGGLNSWKEESLFLRDLIMDLMTDQALL